MLPCRDQQPEATMRRSWTPAERRMSRVGTKSGRRAIGREQLRIRKPQWRWTCQLGSICVLKHVHLEERRSECFCFLTFYSLCSSDAPTARASARSAQRGQTFAEHPQKRSRRSCCLTLLLHSSAFQLRPSLLGRKLQPACATALFFRLI